MISVTHIKAKCISYGLCTLRVFHKVKTYIASLLREVYIVWTEPRVQPFGKLPTKATPNANGIVRVFAIRSSDYLELKTDDILHGSLVRLDWEARVREQTGWTDHDNDDDDDTWKVEIRYVRSSSKYRLILRPGDPAPPLPLVPQKEKKGIRGPRRIMCATLLPNHIHSSVNHLDVTRRVHKYLGPEDDFHSTHVFVEDLFPFDDKEANAARFDSLCMLDSSLKVSTYPLVGNREVLT
jgi:hypothetical protein